MEKHLSSQFDAELSGISSRVLEMGGMVEAQMAQAVYALIHYSGETASQVLTQEERVNTMEMDIDRDLSAIIARRQPTARDLRLLIGISKTIGNLERVGDEAARIARIVHKLLRASGTARMSAVASDLQYAANLALEQLRKSLNALARLDVESAVHVIRDDRHLDTEFEGQMRKLVTYMMEDPRTISASIDMVFVAKAIERVGDHAKNLAEQVVYIVRGDDVRHVPAQRLDPTPG
jgi:phosphate transport system protein